MESGSRQDLCGRTAFTGRTRAIKLECRSDSVAAVSFDVRLPLRFQSARAQAHSRTWPNFQGPFEIVEASWSGRTSSAHNMGALY